MEGTRYRFLLPKPFSWGTCSSLAVDAACQDSGMFCAVSTDVGLALDIAQLSMSDSSINSSAKKD